MCNKKAVTTSTEQFTGLAEDALEVAHKLASATQEPITKIEAATLSKSLLNIMENNRILKAVINGAPLAYAIREKDGFLTYTAFTESKVIERAKRVEGCTVVPVRLVSVRSENKTNEKITFDKKSGK